MQILNIDHLEYVVLFMREKLDKLDKVNEEWGTEELDVGEQIGTPSTASHLGAPEKDKKPLSSLVNTTRFTVPGLPQMLEAFVNRFRTAKEGYYKVKREHMVVYSLLCCQ